MTQLLQQAFAKIAKLPETEQNAFAHWALAELESEKKWSHAFAESEDALATLADEALKEDKAGKTKKINLKGL